MVVMSRVILGATTLGLMASNIITKGQGKSMALLSAEVNRLSAFRRLMVLRGCMIYAQRLYMKQKVHCGKWKVELVLYPDPSTNNKKI
jgi:hypothetical protein